MHYCSLEDAWGSNNISDKYTEYMTNINSNENNENNENMTNNNSNENMTNNNEIKIDYHNNNLMCNDIFLHIKNCEKCQNKLRDEYRPKILYSIKKIIDNNNDIIILIIIGISILLFFNLINNLTKN